MRLCVFAVVLLTFAWSFGAEDYNCGKDFDGKVCTGKYAGQCCSGNGNCGMTDEYCSNGCQAEYGPCICKVPPNDYECGPRVSGKICTGAFFGQCCSRSGYCGTGSEFCGPGCQSSYGACRPT